MLVEAPGHPFWADPPAGVYSRRQFFYAAAGVVTALGFGDSLGAATASAAVSPLDVRLSKVGGNLTMFTWQGYDLTKPLAAWRKSHHINETVKYLNNQFDVASLLKGPAGKKYDLSTANQAYTHLFQKLGIMSPLSAKEVPSLAHMFPFFRNSPIWKWGANSQYYNSVPWTWGANGINFLSDRVPKPKSWNVLIDPRNKGRVGTYDDGYNNISVAAIALGIDLTHITHAKLNGPIKQWLLKLKKNLKAISPNLGDQTTLLVNKEVDYMCIGNSLIQMLAAQQGAKDVGFAIPREGGWGFCDAAFVTPWAPDKQNAYAWCDAILGGKTAAIAANSLLQGVATTTAVPYLSREVRAQYPYQHLNQFLSTRIKFAVNFTPAKGQDIVSFQDANNLWSEIKAS